MNGHSDIDTSEATEHLKNILNVGKTDCTETGKLSSSNMNTPDGSGSFANENAFQKIELSGNEDNYPIYGTNVSILSSPFARNSTNNKIQIDNIVDYGWEHKYSMGSLISLHISKKYFAYALKAPNATFGFVRVMKQNSNDQTLLRDFYGGVKDLSFAHSLSRLLLGCVDEMGDVFIYEIFDDERSLSSELCMHITRPPSTSPSKYHRIVWCPYIPEDGNGLDGGDADQDDVTMFMSSLLVVTHDEKAEIWNIDILIKEYGRGKLSFDEAKTGLQVIAEHSEPITAAAFSPDAIAVATASLDGEVKFFQVNIQENEVTPKCLHKWTPHYGKPLSSLFFLDNHKNHNPEVQFWKYAVTGADNNQEIKVWTCETWNCLQTVRLFSSNTDNVAPCLKAELDLSASYLLLSDISRNVMYIFRIRQDSNVIISSVAEYFVKYPVLSFAIADVMPCKGKLPFNLKNSCDEDDDDDDDEDDKDEDYDDSDSIGRRQHTYILKLYWIHSKSFQFCRILYDPKTESPLQSAASISSSQDSFVYKDGLSDLGNDPQDQITATTDTCTLDHDEHTSSPVPAIPKAASVSAPLQTSSVLRSPGYPAECTEFLLTPKDFTSPHATLPTVNIPNPFTLLGVDSSKDLGISNQLIPDDEVSSLDADPAPRPRRKSSQHSSASSPSREVAEILSPGQILSHEDHSEKKDAEEENRVTDDVLCHSPPLTMRQADYVQNEWPQAPDPNKEYKVIIKNESDDLATHQPIDQSLVRQVAADGNISPDDDDVTDRRSSESRFQRLERTLEALSHKMSSVADAVQRQNQAIQVFFNNIECYEKQQKFLQRNIQTVDTSVEAITSKLDQLLMASDSTRLENLLMKRDSEEVQRHEQQLSLLSQSLNIRIDKAIKQEVVTTVVPSINKSLDGAISRLQGEILQNQNSTEVALKESLAKHLKSKAFSDNLATTAVSLLQQSIQVSCKEVFQNSVMPSMEKCCQMLFAQVNDVFSRGSVDYVNKSERHLQMINTSLENTVRKCDDQINNFLVEAENILTKVATKSQENLMEAASSNEKLLTNVRKIVQEEMHRSLSKHASNAALRSTQSTPAPHNDVIIDPQHILHLARTGRINEAFQMALSAVDVKVVMQLCESVPVEQVFEPIPCPLEQHVLLSLIQQLSAEFTDRTNLRLRYIEDAIASLDDNSPITKTHIGTVLGNLKQKLTYFMECHPNIRVGRNCRRILLTVDSFLK